MPSLEEVLRHATWKCDICGAERPDACIDVRHRPLKGFEASFPDTRFNLKYCNDNLDCITAAHEDTPWPIQK